MMKKANRFFLGILVIMALLPAFGARREALAEPAFEFHLLDVGQGQCVFIRSDGHTMLIDGGGREASSYVVSYLKQNGVSSLDYVAVSHYDEDHMSGCIGVLSAFACDTLLLPSYPGEDALYKSFAAAAISNGCRILFPAYADVFSLGSAQAQVAGPVFADNPIENDRSLAFRVTAGAGSFLICGDAESKGEADMAAGPVDIRSDVYVANHHGSAGSSTDVFLDAVSPSYCLVSCGRDNDYGHPSAEAMARIQDHGCALYRTDLQGTVSAFCDGEKLWFDQEPCNDYSGGALQEKDGPEGSPFPAVPAEDAASGTAYVLNTNTGKFHYPSCASVGDILDHNRLDYAGTREEVMAMGYEPCKRCDP